MSPVKEVFDWLVLERLTVPVLLTYSPPSCVNVRNKYTIINAIKGLISHHMFVRREQTILIYLFQTPLVVCHTSAFVK